MKGHWNYQVSRRLQPFGRLRCTPWRRRVVRWSVSKPRMVTPSRCCQRFSQRDGQQDVLLGARLSSRASQQPYTCSLWCDAAGTCCLHKHRKLKGSCASAQISRVRGNFLTPVVPWPFIKTSVKKKKKLNLWNGLQMLVAWHHSNINSPGKW